jgi:hypothetical protein
VVEGAPFADIFAKTTGTDADFVVKIIDVYPPTVPSSPRWAVINWRSAWISFAGVTARASRSRAPSPPVRCRNTRFRLPTMNYVFKPGHRIMVQIQSSLFPLYDRNPQTYVPNIFFAQPQDYREGNHLDRTWLFRSQRCVAYLWCRPARPRSDRNSVWVRIRANIGKFFSKVKRCSSAESVAAQSVSAMMSEPLLVAGTRGRFHTAIGQESGNGQRLNPA